MSKIFKMRDYKPYNEIKPELDAEKEEAVKESLIEGIDIGEKNKAIKIAENLLKNNVDIDIIISSTGLSKKEIMKIKKNLLLPPPTVYRPNRCTAQRVRWQSRLTESKSDRRKTCLEIFGLATLFRTKNICMLLRNTSIIQALLLIEVYHKTIKKPSP